MTRTQRREAALRQRWLEILQAELVQREAENTSERHEQQLAELVAKLDEMSARLATAPDYRPPTPEENAAFERDFTAFLGRLATP